MNTKMNTTMTEEEIDCWHLDFVKELEKSVKFPITIDDVRFSKAYQSLRFHYGNATGLIFASGGYLGEQADGKNYYPMLQLSCRYSDDSKFNPTFAPTIHAAAVAIKQSWNLFTKP